MKCKNCGYFQCGYLWNACDLTGEENFLMKIDCELVNEDGTVNQELLDEYPR